LHKLLKAVKHRSPLRIIMTVKISDMGHMHWGNFSALTLLVGHQKRHPARKKFVGGDVLRRSFARLTASVVTTTIIILSSNKTG